MYTKRMLFMFVCVAWWVVVWVNELIDQKGPIGLEWDFGVPQKATGTGGVC